MSDETSTLLGAGESLNKGQAVDLLLNTNAPEEASEDAQEPVAEIEEVVETDEMEATSEDEFEVEDAEELPEADEEYEDDDEEYDVDVSEIEEVEDEIEYYTVKIDGEEKSVTADELVKSYQLEQAAQKRMQEAAEIRKNSETEVAALAQQQSNMLKLCNRCKHSWIVLESSPKNIGIISTAKTRWSICVNVRPSVTVRMRWKK